MIPHGLIQDRIEQLAFQLYQDHQNSMPHLLVVLKGSVDFANDVANNWRRIHSYGTHELPPFTTDYIRVQSYKGMESTGKGWYFYILYLVVLQRLNLLSQSQLRLLDVIWLLLRVATS